MHNTFTKTVQNVQHRLTYLQDIGNRLVTVTLAHPEVFFWKNIFLCGRERGVMRMGWGGDAGLPTQKHLTLDYDFLLLKHCTPV